MIIDKTGKYISKTGGYVLIVEIDKNSIVQYKVMEHNSNHVLFSDDAGSAYQRWYFLWDEDDVLWSYSSDIGSFVWSKNSNDKWLKNRIYKNSCFFKEMPQEFSNNLPITLRKVWGLEQY